MNHISKLKLIIFSMAIAITLGIFSNSKAIAHSVCGLKGEIASYKTNSYLITICPGEASFQLIMTFHDGTGYRIVPVEREGRLFRGTDGKNNFIIDDKLFVIGTDGEPPIRETVIEFR